jgi:hypothetical protein
MLPERVQPHADVFQKVAAKEIHSVEVSRVGYLSVVSY